MNVHEFPGSVNNQHSSSHGSPLGPVYRALGGAGKDRRRVASGDGLPIADKMAITVSEITRSKTVYFNFSLLFTNIYFSMNISFMKSTSSLFLL